MIVKHNSILDILCDDCKKKVRTMYKIDEILTEIDAINKDNNKQTKNLKELDEKNLTVENEKTALENELDRIKKLLNNLTETYRETEKQKEDIKTVFYKYYFECY